MEKLIGVIAVTAIFSALTGCGNFIPDRVECEGGCIDQCGSWPHNNLGGKRAKHSTCATEYNNGYDLGYCAGVRGEHIFGVNPDPYVAGYYDGFADGETAKQNQREQNACRG
jgi:hypothetical protein